MPVKNGARAVPAGYDTLGWWTLPGAPWITRLQAVTPNVRTQPTPAVTQPRGVEDAAPYGRLRNVGISITVNRCRNAADLLPALGSPERGAVAALCAVTEGLVRRRCGRTNVIRQPRPGGRGSPPLRGVGRWARGTGAVGRPTAAHRGRCALRRVRKVSALQIRCPSSGGRGVEDAAPYGGCVWLHFSGAVRYSLSHQLRCMPQVRFRCRP